MSLSAYSEQIVVKNSIQKIHDKAVSHHRPSGISRFIHRVIDNIASKFKGNKVDKNEEKLTLSNVKLFKELSDGLVNLYFSNKITEKNTANFQHMIELALKDRNIGDCRALCWDVMSKIAYRNRNEENTLLSVKSNMDLFNGYNEYCHKLGKADKKFLNPDYYEEDFDSNLNSPEFQKDGLGKTVGETKNGVWEEFDVDLSKLELETFLQSSRDERTPVGRMDTRPEDKQSSHLSYEQALGLLPDYEEL